MAKIIIYVDGAQILIEETQVKIYDPFPDNQEKKNEPPEESGNSD